MENFMKEQIEETKITKVERDKKIDEKFERFLDLLKSVVNLVRGCGGDQWKDKTLEEVYKSLYPNSIILGFKIDPNYFVDKTYISL